MVKKSIGTNVFIYPMPVVLAGTQADNRANFMAVGWVTRANLNPPMVAIGLNKSHFTSNLIKKNQEPHPKGWGMLQVNLRFSGN